MCAVKRYHSGSKQIISLHAVYNLHVFEPAGVRLPASHKTVYSYFVDLDSGNFMPWDTLVPSTQSLIEKGSVLGIGDTLGANNSGQVTPDSDSDMVVTVDTVRYSFLIGLLVLNKHPLLLTG